MWIFPIFITLCRHTHIHRERERERERERKKQIVGNFSLGKGTML
jgi:hypothetical protein